MFAEVESMLPCCYHTTSTQIFLSGFGDSVRGEPWPASDSIGFEGPRSYVYRYINNTAEERKETLGSWKKHSVVAKLRQLEEA
jgi:hypothetical protein